MSCWPWNSCNQDADRSLREIQLNNNRNERKSEMRGTMEEKIRSMNLFSEEEIHKFNLNKMPTVVTESAYLKEESMETKSSSEIKRIKDVLESENQLFNAFEVKPFVLSPRKRRDCEFKQGISIVVDVEAEPQPSLPEFDVTASTLRKSKLLD